MPSNLSTKLHKSASDSTRSPIDPRVRHLTIASKALGVSKKLYVALPPGYGSSVNANRRYPVLYLFRGHEREWIHRWQDKSRHGHTVIDIYRKLLENGEVGPMILVFPGISSDDNRIPGLLVNFLNAKTVEKVPGVGTGRFHDYFVQDLMPFIDKTFRTIANRRSRAVDGFSLGGFQSIKIAAEHPELFCSAGAFDGTFLYATDRGRSVRANDRVLRNPIFAPAFGSPFDSAFVSANNPANLLWKTERSALADVQWMVRSGPEVAEPWQANYFRARHVIGILEERKLGNAVPGVFTSAVHSWSWADKHMAGTMPLHWKAMAQAGDGTFELEDRASDVPA